MRKDTRKPDIKSVISKVFPHAHMPTTKMKGKDAIQDAALRGRKRREK